MRLLWLVALTLAMGCKDTPPVVDRFADKAPDVATEEEEHVAEPRAIGPAHGLVWPGDFARWYNQPVAIEEHLPTCRSRWLTYAIDDEFIVWKCEKFGDTGITNEGELAVHTRSGRVFMVTVTVDFATVDGGREMLDPLREVNRDRQIELTKDEAKLVSDLWNLGTSYAGLSASDAGFSVLYMNSRDQLQDVMTLIARQTAISQIGKVYALGDLRYTIQTIEKVNSVGRGRDKWTARNDSDFFVVRYQIENRGKVVLDQDPSAMSLVSGSQVIEPNQRAMKAYLDGDRTGQLVLPLKARAKRQRVQVFEVSKTASSRPMTLIVANGDQKLLYRADFTQ